MMSFRWLLNKVLNRIGVWQYSHISWWATWLYNLRHYDLTTAIKLPVLIYNGVDHLRLAHFELLMPQVYKGVVQIGCSPAKAQRVTSISTWGGVKFFYMELSNFGAVAPYRQLVHWSLATM